MCSDARAQQRPRRTQAQEPIARQHAGQPLAEFWKATYTPFYFTTQELQTMSAVLNSIICLHHTSQK